MYIYNTVKKYKHPIWDKLIYKANNKGTCHPKAQLTLSDIHTSGTMSD